MQIKVSLNRDYIIRTCCRAAFRDLWMDPPPPEPVTGNRVAGVAGSLNWIRISCITPAPCIASICSGLRYMLQSLQVLNHSFGAVLAQPWQLYHPLIVVFLFGFWFTGLPQKTKGDRERTCATACIIIVSPGGDRWLVRFVFNIPQLRRRHRSRHITGGHRRGILIHERARTIDRSLLSYCFSLSH